MSIAVHDNPSLSCRASSAIWDHSATYHSSQFKCLA